VQRISRRDDKSKRLIELFGGTVLGMHYEGSDAGNARRLEGILEQFRADPSPLPAEADGPPSQQHDWHWIPYQSFAQPLRRIPVGSLANDNQSHR
jgi:hypothetical protein